jgi:hypothetical protein
MNVEELIRQLQALPPDAQVVDVLIEDEGEPRVVHVRYDAVSECVWLECEWT